MERNSNRMNWAAGMFLPLLFLCNQAFSQQLRGRVVDASNQKGLSGATVSVAGRLGQAGTTDADGRFSLLLAKTDTLVVSWNISLCSLFAICEQRT